MSSLPEHLRIVCVREDRDTPSCQTGPFAILEILYYDPKGRRALLRVPSTVGRSVCLCWEH